MTEKEVKDGLPLLHSFSPIQNPGNGLPSALIRIALLFKFIQGQSLCHPVWQRVGRGRWNPSCRRELKPEN